MIQTGPGLKLQSDPRVRRVGSEALWVAIAIGMVFSVLWILVSVFVAPYNLYWAVVMASAAIAFVLLLGFTAYGSIRDGKRRYYLELTDSEAVLTVTDSLEKKKFTQMVLLDDIIYAEYYPYRDSRSIIFHTSYARMEVPLWPLPGMGQDVVDFLDGRGVPVVDVQSDDPIPDPVG
ncbi:MAG: hypothetical protein AB7W16_22940 [Candidatus Obscuribacterales bacterium]